jgi:hypothetical protein
MAAKKVRRFFCVIIIVVLLFGCGSLERFKRWEDVQENKAQKQGAADYADDMIAMTFTFVGEKEVRFRLQNKTAGRIIFRWDEVSFRFPSGEILPVVPGGEGGVTVVPAMSAFSGSFSAVGSVSYLADEDRWKDPDDSFNAQQEFSIDMPLEIEAIGGKKDYSFSFVTS